VLFASEARLLPELVRPGVLEFHLSRFVDLLIEDSKVELGFLIGKLESLRFPLQELHEQLKEFLGMSADYFYISRFNVALDCLPVFPVHFQ